MSATSHPSLTYMASTVKSHSTSPNETIPPRFRAPTSFGPSPGPRQARHLPNHPPSPFPRSAWQSPTSAAIVTGVTYVCRDPSAITRLLPDGFTLSPLVTSGRRQPTVLFERMDLRGLPWLAGRGYNTWGVFLNDVICTRANVRPMTGTDPLGFRDEEQGVLSRVGPQATIGASFLLVLFENECDPIVTGREELGFPKVWAEMPDVDTTSDDGGEKVWTAVSWRSFVLVLLKDALRSESVSCRSVRPALAVHSLG